MEIIASTMSLYTLINSLLFVNLFIAFRTELECKGIKIKQETNFPYEEQTKLIVTEGASKFRLMIRHPSWVADGELKIFVNGKIELLSSQSQPSSYFSIDRLWKKGDVIIDQGANAQFN
jgi:DUF1680 family protein